jgi:hypothetical protein
VRLLTKLLIVLVFLGLVDMAIPIPILGIVLIYVILQKPSWFLTMVKEVYGE